MDLSFDHVCSVWNDTLDIDYDVKKLDVYRDTLDCDDNYYPDILYQSGMCDIEVYITKWMITIRNTKITIRYDEVAKKPSKYPPVYLPYIAAFLLKLYGYTKKVTITVIHYPTCGDKQLVPYDPPIITYESTNAGFTNGCGGWNISIYRQVNSDKVFIHEILHNLCLDMDTSSISDMVSREFNIDNRRRLRLSEAYVDAMTDYFYVCIISGCNYKKFINYIGDILQHNINIAYSMSRYLGRSSPIDRKNPWVEDTNAFAYYVIKPVLLYHINEVKKNPSISKWIDWIYEFYNQKHEWEYTENYNRLPSKFITIEDVIVE